MLLPVQCPKVVRYIPLIALLAAGCSKTQTSYNAVTVEAGAIKSTPAQAPSGGHIATFDQKIQLWRASVEPKQANPGDTVTLTLTFVALENLFEDWRIFVHGQLAGAEMTQLQDDHDPLDGLYPTSRWRKGDIVEEKRSIRLPPRLMGKTFHFYVGLYSGDQRMSVVEAGKHDGQNRVPAAILQFSNGVDEMRAQIFPAVGAIAVDGKLDEAAWQQAQRLGPFVHYHGKGVPGNSTFARLSYDAQALYVAFECADKDIWTSFTERDDPIYNEEAVEIFIDIDKDLKTYVELQNSPANVHFDAAFVGRRKNMDKAYNADYQTAVALDGTLNNPADQDRGWVSEWRIPFDQIRGFKKAPQPGDSWRINLFRLDKVRRGGRIAENQASAWSSPLSGDFHNISRFGWLEFKAAPPAGSQPAVPQSP